MGKPLRDILPQTADTYHHFRLIVDTSQMVRDKERLPLVQDRRVGLRKDHRLIRPLQRPVQLLVMCGIVHANSEYLHVAPILGQKYKKNRQFPIIRPFFLREGNISFTCARKISYV